MALNWLLSGPVAVIRPSEAVKMHSGTLVESRFFSPSPRAATVCEVEPPHLDICSEPVGSTASSL